MILDNLLNYKQYTGAHPLFEKAFKFLLENPLATMEPGTYEIDGNNVYAMIQEPEGHPVETAQMEVHKKYIDLQFLVSGNETIGWAPLCGLGHSLGFNEDSDFGLYKDKPLAFFDLRPGCFAIFYPGDAHAPCCGTGKRRKVVIKITA